MPISWGSNTQSLSIIRYMNSVNTQLNKSMERLASGYKLNHASDGPALLQISENLNSQIRGYDMATSNVQSGLSMLQTADESLQQITDTLQDIRDIAVAASNGTTSTAQFAAYQADLQAALGVIDTISSNTKYGSNVLLNGSISGGSGFTLQIGPNSGDTMDIKAAFTNNASGAGGLAITQTTLSNTTHANTLLTQVDAAINTATTNLSTIGGYESRLTYHMDYLSVAKINTAASQASIRNADIAAETSNAARLQILQQAGAYALSKSNQFPGLLLQLIQS